jgi:hypothetical protein
MLVSTGIVTMAGPVSGSDGRRSGNTDCGRILEADPVTADEEKEEYCRGTELTKFEHKDLTSNLQTRMSLESQLFN